MHETHRFPHATESTVSSGASSGFANLSPEIHAHASRRLAAAALCYAGAYLVIFGIEWVSLMRFRDEFCAPAAGDGIRSLVSIVGSLLVAKAAWKGLLPARSFLQLATAYPILGGLGIVGGMWGWEGHLGGALTSLQQTGADLGAVVAQKIPILRMGGVHWLGIWLLCFPLIVPLPPRWAYLATFLTAMTLPTVLLASQWAHGVPPILEPFVASLYFDTLFPIAVVAGIAVFGFHTVYGLTRDLSKARKLGSYHLVEKIGEGGMGEVWKARHQLLARPAAVKLIRAEAFGGTSGSGGPTAARRFEREAQATAGLTSPHTIDLYDFGSTKDGTFYYVMELLDGVDLKTLVEKFGPLPAERVVHILRQAAHSLRDAHTRDLVHRDIKPANLFVCRMGPEFDFVKVLDFGLVKDATREERGTQLTMEGVTSGTPTFMAPEMAHGSQNLDGRADIYALGCVGYWLLTGQLVFEGETTLSILLQHAKDDPPPPSIRTELRIPDSLEKLILECLAKEPSSRPPSAKALLERLDEIGSSLAPWSEDRAERWWRTHLPDQRPISPPSERAGVDTIAFTP